MVSECQRDLMEVKGQEDINRRYDDDISCFACR